MPYEFLLIKDLLVRECLRQGFLTKDAATNTVKLGKYKIERSGETDCLNRFQRSNRADFRFSCC